MAEPVIENPDSRWRLPASPIASRVATEATPTSGYPGYSCSAWLLWRLFSSVTGVRRLHCSAAAWAGGQWRLQQGLAANPSGYGPLTELPDWSYAETSCTAVTGNGRWITSMAAQAAEVAGRTKEAGKCS
nr:39S ribosomal protein L52, mitochondrial isoform X4 [Pongo abelii]